MAARLGVFELGQEAVGNLSHVRGGSKLLTIVWAILIIWLMVCNRRGRTSVIKWAEERAEEREEEREEEEEGPLVRQQRHSGVFVKLIRFI